MPIKVTIVKGKGRVSCVMPGFHLNEKTRPSVFVEETTEQLDSLIERKLVTVSDTPDGDIDKLLKVASKRLTEKAKKEKLAALELEKKTGGVHREERPDGTVATIIPAALTPDEVRAIAAAEKKAIESGDTSELDSILNDSTITGALGSQGS